MDAKTGSVNEMYQLANYYDIVFDRDVAPQVAFCIRAYEHFAGRKPGSMLDLACGPGYYAREFARQGLRATGLDLSAGMIAFARERARQEQLNLHYIEADMSAFTLDAPVDLVVSMFDAIDFLLNQDALVNHFEAVAANLTPNGLYLIQQTPSARSHSVYNPGTYHYRGQRAGSEVDFAWGVNDPRADLTTGIMAVEMEIQVIENGQETLYRDQSTERVCLPTELILVAERVVGAFRHVGSYGDFDLSRAPDWLENTPYIITVLQKRQ
jgi:SAM-dependent methyltransferase